MANLSSQKLNQFYEQFSQKEIAFSKSILQVTGLETRKVFLKIRGEQFPCVVYSCSMKASKIIINLDNVGFEEIKRAKNFVSLRLSFFPKDAKNPVVFFVPSIVRGYNTFNIKSSNTTAFLMSMDFTQKPPDDLIEIIGRILEASENFEKRKSLRIALEGRVIEDMGLHSNKSVAVIDNIKRPCILKNLSAFGCMVVMQCNLKFILNKKISLEINSKELNSQIIMEGLTVRAEEVSDRKDIYGIGIQFEEDKIPFEYKEILNSYMDKLEDMMKNKQ
ncbi:MAG TPA: pilus assembly protein PilZ [Spirochaetota bacterium]|nr:pilus assembly protein PilZ [Spirochaetota bacterium]